MRKLGTIFGLLFIILLVFLFVFQVIRGRVKEDLSAAPRIARSPSITAPVAAQERTTASLFVPYWTLSGNEDFSDYDTVIYFGISSTLNGINQEDQGYRNIQRFVQSTHGEKTMLTLRMLDNTQNLTILKNQEAQKALIAQTIAIAQANAFSGVILDLELNALPFDSLLKQINSFVKDFAETAREEGVEFSLTIYGDTFYRVRPFDIKTLSQHADAVYIMAYDFHKAGGNPGPNFPLSGKEQYGYDFPTMLTDFLTAVPPEKIVVTYGMFGYDWEIDGEGKATKQGEALSDHQVRERIIKNCEELSCHVEQNESTYETSISYQAEDGKKHLVWFEDEDSVRKKEAFAKTLGISRVSFWAYSYF